ncbi:MAG: LolA family protein [Candidatus Levyibacteriota bacterium]
MGPAIATTATDTAPSRTTIASLARTAALLLAIAWSAGASAGAADVLARSRAVYAGLHAYSDTGTVVVEFGNAPTPSREQHAFRTWYRAPRLFRFDFTKANQADRYEVWSDEQVFRTWWKATGGTSTYPKGQGASAFTTGSVTTYGALTAIAPWLFSQAGLTGTLTELGDAADGGTEVVAGHPCHKIVGVARSVYGATGRTTNVRNTTVWIDAKTLLVRRILEDASEGRIVSRKTISFEPVADPPLEDVAFRFVPPAR